MARRKYDAVHEFYGSFSMSPESTTANYNTIIPIIMNDDARGDPMDLMVHPEHASWSELAFPNCFTDSEIKGMRITVFILIPPGVANEISQLMMEYALISSAFPEDLDAKDENNALTVKEMLELQKETTDRQCYPLWNTVNLVSGSLLHANVPGLAGDQIHEAVAWSSEIVRDALKYGSVKGLLKKMLPIGIRNKLLRWNFSKGKMFKLTFNFTPSNSKYINPYTFLGLMIRMRQAVAVNLTDASNDQLVNIAHTTADASSVIYLWHVSYFERNPDFHMARI